MSFSTTETEIGYLCDGVEMTFEIPFVYSHVNFIRVEVYDETDPDNVVITELVKDIDFRFVDSETIETIELVVVGPDLVPTPTPILAGRTLRIFRDTADIHDITYNTYQFPYDTVTTDFDKVYQRLQELRRDVDRAIKLGYLAMEQGESLTGEEIQEAIAQLTSLLDQLETGAGLLPTGGATGDFLEKVVDPITEDESGVWKSGSYSGFSARFNEAFESTGLDDTLRKILNFSYLGPQISLSATPAQSVREKGVVVASVSLTANTTKRSENITEVRFYRAGVLVNTDLAPSPDGTANSTYTDNTAFSDNMSFYAQVDDGTSTVTSNTVTYSFVYPYYYGCRAPSASGAQIAALTKSVIASSANLNRSFTALDGDVFYHAYPKAYGKTTLIEDQNGFNVTASWTEKEVNITGLDASSVVYYVYEFNNIQVAGSASFTFKR